MTIYFERGYTNLQRPEPCCWRPRDEEKHGSCRIVLTSLPTYRGEKGGLRKETFKQASKYNAYFMFRSSLVALHYNNQSTVLYIDSRGQGLNRKIRTMERYVRLYAVSKWEKRMKSCSTVPAIFVIGLEGSDLYISAGSAASTAPSAHRLTRRKTTRLGFIGLRLGYTERVKGCIECKSLSFAE